MRISNTDLLMAQSERLAQELWRARKWADIWQNTWSRTGRHVVLGTFSSAKQSYFCLRDSLQTKTLTNLVSLKKKKRAFWHASTSLAYSQGNAPYRQKEMKNYWRGVNRPLPTTKHCYFHAKYTEIKGTAQRTVCLTAFLKAMSYTII